MERIDRKFYFTAVSLKSKKKYSDNNAVVFLAKDALLPALLDHYYALCVEHKVDERQLKGVALLRERVMKFQAKHTKKVHVPDVDEGKEETRVCKPNR
jgi:hypothetical protein